MVIVKVDELRAAEAMRAAELAKAGHLVRPWRPPLGPGEWRSIGLFRAPPVFCFLPNVLNNVE
jgi:muconolactone delta-isomerase